MQHAGETAGQRKRKCYFTLSLAPLDGRRSATSCRQGRMEQGRWRWIAAERDQHNIPNTHASAAIILLAGPHSPITAEKVEHFR